MFQQRVFCFALTIATLFAISASASAQDRLLRWHESLEGATAAARLSGKPLCVVFRCVR